LEKAGVANVRVWTSQMIQRVSRRKEASMKRIVSIVTLALLVCGSFACNGQANMSTSEVIQAQRFELVNAQGEVVGALASTDDGPGLRLYDSNGKARLTVAVEADGPAVTLLAADEKPKARLNLGNDGHPGLALIDTSGKTRYDLRLRQDERPCMLFWDVTAPKPRMGFGINPKGNPNAVLFDPQGNRRLWVQLLADEGPSVGVGTAKKTVWTTPPAK
jgi:hypothetical protein